MPTPLTQADFIKNLDRIKEEVLQQATSNHHLSHFQIEDESIELLFNEYRMQHILRKDLSIESAIPVPVGVGYDSTSRRHFFAYRPPEGYYTYLSDIRDRDIFINIRLRVSKFDFCISHKD